MGRALIDLTLFLHMETKPGRPDEGAIRVSDDGDDRRAVWIPKSLLEFVPVRNTKNVIIVTLPENIAKQKGLN